MSTDFDSFWNGIVEDRAKRSTEVLSVEEISGELSNLIAIVWFQSEDKVGVTWGIGRHDKFLEGTIKDSLIHHIKVGSSLVKLGRGRNGPQVIYK